MPKHAHSPSNRTRLIGPLLALLSVSTGLAQDLLPDPSFEKPMDRNRWGHVFSEWYGNVYEGSSRFEVGQVARTGQHSCEMVGAVGGKIRVGSKPSDLPLGRYRLTAYLRALDLGKGRWGNTIDVSLLFDDKWMGLKPTGTFGWTPLTYVVDVPAGAKQAAVYLGLWEEGHLWVDDVSLEKVGAEVALTEAPVLGKEEAPITMPGPLGPNPVRCPSCEYRNDPKWGKCYMCGSKLEAATRTFTSPAEVVFADFEDGTRAPFGAGEAVAEHATSGKYSLRLDADYTTIDTPQQYQSWAEYDYVLFDVFNPGDKSAGLYIEVRDALTTDYWTRVNLTSVAPPGESTVTIPTALYVGEKSRPGRPLVRDRITRYVVSVGQDGPVFLDNFRLTRLDTSAVLFDELRAWDFGPADAPVMEGFTRGSSGMPYSEGRGYGWVDAEWWRDFNVLQPDLLYQDFVCLRSGTFRVDLPNGKFHVFLNLDSPGGFWGEVQIYHNRTVTANGETVVDETMDLEGCRAKYFRNASREDLPGIDTFSEYVERMFDEKQFDVDVTDGKLELGFKGEGWAISLSALVVYPDAKKAAGEQFLTWVVQRRSTQFNDYFKQTAPKPAGSAKPAAGYRVFPRSPMAPAQAYDGPLAGEELAQGNEVALSVAKGEERALVLAVQPGEALGSLDLAVTQPLTNEKGAKLDAAALQVGWLDYRISRVQMDGSVYTVRPRYWHPTPAPDAPGVTRNFWIRVRTGEAAPGKYRGKLTVKPANGKPRDVPVVLDVLPFALDPITDVAAGPWGCSIGLPWFGDDAATQEWDRAMLEKGLDVLHELGCTSFSGYPHLRVGAANGNVTLDTAIADREMALIREKGFTQMLSNYGVGGYLPYDPYTGPTDAQAKQAGFADAAEMVKQIWKAVDDHAVADNWLPVAWNLCDEPIGDAIPPVVRNAKLHRDAAKGLQRTFFSGATSMTGNDPKDPHYDLVRALQIPNLNGHDEASLGVIRDAGGRFAFYNGGNRWTFGRYMKMLVRKHQLALRLTWHYNVAAGDPYYALDCREDDYCWFNTNANGDLVPSLQILGSILPGLNDSRYLCTLERLLKEKPNNANHAKSQAVFDEMMGLEAGKDRDRQADFDADRAKVVEAITALL